jgi:hypothetical protein
MLAMLMVTENLPWASSLAAGWQIHYSKHRHTDRSRLKQRAELLAVELAEKHV